jgi:hypothetical protein
MAKTARKYMLKTPAPSPSNYFRHRGARPVNTRRASLFLGPLSRHGDELFGVTA